MKKAFTVLFSLLALVCANPVAESDIPSNGATPTHQATAKVVFRGLMAFQPDAGRQYLDVGILYAPQHEFRIQVKETSDVGGSVVFIPVPPASTPRSVWTLVSANSNAGGISFYQTGAFDRAADLGHERDTRWLIDLEGAEFHKRQLTLTNDQLRLVLRVSAGDFYTNKRTAALMRRKGDGRFQYFGRVTEELATDISLVEGDLVIRLENGAELLRLKHNPGIAYEITIENAFTGDHHTASRVNHFAYYYGLLTEPITDKFEFRTVKGTDFRAARLMSAKYASVPLPMTDEAPCSPIILGGGR